MRWTRRTRGASRPCCRPLSPISWRATINSAVANLWSAFLTLVAGAVLPLLEPAINAVRQPVQNLANVLSNPAIVALPALGLLNVAYRTITVAGTVGQEIVDSATAGDPLGVVNAMLSSPAVITDAFLNGDELGGGVFGPSLGLLSTLRQAREMIAARQSPPPVAEESARAAADTTLPSAAKVVDARRQSEGRRRSPAPAVAPSSAGTGRNRSCCRRFRCRHHRPAPPRW